MLGSVYSISLNIGEKAIIRDKVSLRSSTGSICHSGYRVAQQFVILNLTTILQMVNAQESLFHWKNHHRTANDTRKKIFYAFQ